MDKTFVEVLEKREASYSKMSIVELNAQINFLNECLFSYRDTNDQDVRRKIQESINLAKSYQKELKELEEYLETIVQRYEEAPKSNRKEIMKNLQKEARKEESTLRGKLLTETIQNLKNVPPIIETKGKVHFFNRDFFHKNAQKQKATPEHRVVVSKTFLQKLVAISVTSGSIVTIFGIAMYGCGEKNTSVLSEETIEAPLETEEETISENSVEPVVTVSENSVSDNDLPSKEEECIAKIDEIYEIYKNNENLKNIERKQIAAFYILTNVRDLDRITKDNLIKSQILELSENLSPNYTLENEDFEKVLMYTLELRTNLINETNRLVEAKKFTEAKEILDVTKKFVGNEEYVDEMSILIDSVKNMYTDDRTQIKHEAYRFYNYFYEGITEQVRHFKTDDEYGFYYSSVPTDCQFLTWYLNGFVSSRISGKEIIPNDIMRDLEKNLADFSKQLRLLGIQCESEDLWEILNSFYGDQGKNNGGSGKKSGSGSTSTSNIAHATNDPVLDQEIHDKLQGAGQLTVGQSIPMDNDQTMIIVETGPRDTMVVIPANPNSAVTYDTTPPGENSRTTTEGGGNEHTEEIHFEEDKTNEDVIQEGGEVISSGTDTKTSAPEVQADTVVEEKVEEPSHEPESQSDEKEEIEEIHFEEDKSDTETISDQARAIKISVLTDMKHTLQGIDSYLQTYYTALDAGFETIDASLTITVDHAKEKTMC